MTQYLFLQIVSNKWEQKQRVPDTYYITNHYRNVIKIHEDYIEFNTEEAENKKALPKGYVENADLYKTVLIK